MSRYWHHSTNVQGRTPLVVASNPSTETTVALASGYTYGVSGVALCTHFEVPENCTLYSFYIVIQSVSGTWASTDQKINWEIHTGVNINPFNYSPASAIALSGTATVPTSATLEWLCVSGINYSLNKNQVYGLVIGDEDSTASNYTTLIAHIRETNTTSTIVDGKMISTTNGWTGAGTQISYPPALVINTSIGTFAGSIFRGSGSSDAGSTYRRGIKLALDNTCVPLEVYGIGRPGFNLSGSTFEIFEGVSASPSDTPVYKWNLPNTESTINTQYLPQVITLPTTYTLKPNKTYWFMFKPNVINSGAWRPTYTYADSVIKSTFSGIKGVSYARVLETVGPVWTTYDDRLDSVSYVYLFPAYPKTIVT
jgi:hypothetical protein